MYKCSNCGEIFEEPNAIKEDWGETFYVCPHCNGDYEEAKQCQECDEWNTEDEIYDGWCEKCLRETINYDTFFEYCEANKDEQYLDTFVMCEILNCEYVPKISSEEFHQLMCRAYWERVSEIQRERKVFGKSFSEIISACIRFIMDDDGSIGRENYADWLNKREVK
jgi:hypothetical protein